MEEDLRRKSETQKENRNGGKRVMDFLGFFSLFFFLGLVWFGLTAMARELNTEKTVEKRRRMNKQTLYIQSYQLAFFIFINLFIKKKKRLN